MIRVVVYQERNGLWAYRVDGHWGPGGAPLIGLAENPLLEACRVLDRLGVRPDMPVDLFHGRRRLVSTTIERGGKLLAQAKALLPGPKGRRARRRVLQVRGSGIPGDG